MSGQAKQLINDMLSSNAFYIALALIGVLALTIIVMTFINHKRMKKKGK